LSTGKVRVYTISHMKRKGTYFLYGNHAVEAALKNGSRSCIRLIAEGRDHTSLISLARGRSIPFEAGEPSKAAGLRGDDAVHQGVALEVEPLPGIDLQSLKPAKGQRNLIIILDQVTDPHNVGAIFRSAAAFGVRAIVTPDRHTAPETGVLGKAASGALDIVPWVRVTNLGRALHDLFEMEYWRLGLDADAKKTIADVDLGENIALVLGAEGKGMRRMTAEHCDLLAKIPMPGKIDSLNVSNAAAVALYALSA